MLVVDLTAATASRVARREPIAVASLLDVCASNPLCIFGGVHTDGLFVAAMVESRVSRVVCSPHPEAFLEVHAAAVVHLLCSTQLELWYRCLTTVYYPKTLPSRLCVVPVCLSDLGRRA